MKRQGLDALVLANQGNVFYFSSFSKMVPGEGCLILPLNEEPTLVVSYTQRGNAERLTWVSNLRNYSKPGDPWPGTEIPTDANTAIREAIREKNLHGKKLGVDTEGLKDALGEEEALDCNSLTWEIRIRKSKFEVDKIRKVSRVACKAIETGFEELKAGMNEMDFAAIVYQSLIKLSGGNPPAFMTIRSGSDKCKMINGPQVSRRILKGDLVVLDTGATLDGYASDVMRTACVGKATDKQKRLHALELKAQQTGVKACKPGVKACDVLRAVLKVFKEAGIEPGRYTERCGHGLGIGGYNPPYLNLSDTTPLAEGMVITVEPNLWDAPLFGNPTMNIAIEDTLLMTKDSAEVLTPLNRDLWET